MTAGAAGTARAPRRLGHVLPGLPSARHEDARAMRRVRRRGGDAVLRDVVRGSEAPDDGGARGGRLRRRCACARMRGSSDCG